MLTRPGKTYKDQRKHRLKVGRKDPDGKGREEHIKRELRRGISRQHTPAWEYKEREKRSPKLKEE